MNCLRMARVAPEKAVFRPALPVRSEPALNGATMQTKLTYKEQLLHPNWQRKRLEMLAASNWKCSGCGGTDTTLHVHHKRYIKGRMAWEYDIYELIVLCEKCHATEHSDGGLLQTINDGMETSKIVALLCGFNHNSDWFEREDIDHGRGRDAIAYASGLVAYLAYSLCDIELIRRVAEFASSLAEDGAESKMVYTYSRRDAFGEEESK